MSGTSNLDAIEFLVKLGLRKKGQRGRLSEAAIDALQVAVKTGFTFKNWDNEARKIIKLSAPKTGTTRKKKVEKDPTIKAANASGNWVRVRGANKMVVVCDDGVEVTLDSHDVCGRSISQCVCRNIQPPKYLNAETFRLVV